MHNFVGMRTAVAAGVSPRRNNNDIPFALSLEETVSHDTNRFPPSCGSPRSWRDELANRNEYRNLTSPFNFRRKYVQEKITRMQPPHLSRQDIQKAHRHAAFKKSVYLVGKNPLDSDRQLSSPHVSMGRVAIDNIDRRSVTMSPKKYTNDSDPTETVVFSLVPEKEWFQSSVTCPADSSVLRGTNPFLLKMEDWRYASTPRSTNERKRDVSSAPPLDLSKSSSSLSLRAQSLATLRKRMKASIDSPRTTPRVKSPRNMDMRRTPCTPITSPPSSARFVSTTYRSSPFRPPSTPLPRTGGFDVKCPFRFGK